MKADLAEEVMRMVGVDNVPVDPLPRLNHVAPRMLTTLQNRRRLARRTLAARGLDEAVTWSFITEAAAQQFGGGKPELKLANPIASNSPTCGPRCCRDCLLPRERNTNRGFADLKLFEVGQVFHSITARGPAHLCHRHPARQRPALAGAGRQGFRVRRQGRYRGAARRARARYRQAAARRRARDRGAIRAAVAASSWGRR